MFRWVSYLLSQYLWIGVVAGLVSFPFYLEYSNTVDISKSRVPSLPFNESYVPDYFAHLSDIHINHKYEDRIKTFKTALSRTEKLNPMLAFFTGDLADDFTKDTHPNYGTQQPEDHEIYHNLTMQYEKHKFFDMAGNHDEYGAYGFASEGNNYHRFHNEETEETFYLKIVNFTLRNGRTVHFFLMNPYNFPSAHPPLLFWPAPSKSFLDKIEDGLEKIPKGDEIVFMNHYPVNMFLCLRKSKKNRSFKEIAKTINYAISGHNHPKYPVYQHHNGGLLEIVGTDLKVHKRMGIFTFDNDRFVYHYFNNSKPNFLFITNPVPNEQLSEKQIFNELGTPIKCIVFANKEPNLTISGAVNSTMICSNVTQYKGNLVESGISGTYSMFLCSAPTSDLKSGSYSIQINGTFNKTLDFTLGENVPTFKEIVYTHSKIFQFPLIFVVTFIFSLIIFLPFPSSPSEKVESYERWLEGDDETNGSFIMLTVFGFMAMRYRISLLPNWIRYILFLFTLYSLFGPISFMEIENHLSVIWWFGYISNGKSIYALWGQMYAAFYISLSLTPIACIASSLALKQLSWIIIIDILIAIGFACGTGFVIYRYLSESVNMLYSMLSPGFIIIPIALYLTLIIWRIKKSKDSLQQYDNIFYNLSGRTLL